MPGQSDELHRGSLPIPDLAYTGTVTYDATSPDTKYPPIRRQPPEGAPNVLADACGAAVRAQQRHQHQEQVAHDHGRRRGPRRRRRWRGHRPRRRLWRLVGVGVEFAYDGSGLGNGRTVWLSTNGTKIGEGRVERTLPYQFSFDETVDVGCDTASPVSPEYGPTGNEFTGTIACVRIDVGEALIKQ